MQLYLPNRRSFPLNCKQTASFKRSFHFLKDSLADVTKSWLPPRTGINLVPVSSQGTGAKNPAVNAFHLKSEIP